MLESLKRKSQGSYKIMPDIVYSIGSRIFKNNEPLNAPPPPQDCSSHGCAGIDRASGYISRWDANKRKCVCVKDEPNAVNCNETYDNDEQLVILTRLLTKGDCCCDCTQEAQQDCASRGWSIRGPDETQTINRCACNCEERNIFDESLYIDEASCPQGLWDPVRCFCDCPQSSCLGNQVLGPNCICQCDPLTIPPSGCGVDNKGRIGLFDSIFCKCIYPCAPGQYPYICTTIDGDRILGCSDCEENEHLSPCDSAGVRHCCEYGYVWKEQQYGSSGACVQCTPDNYPSCDGNINKVNPLTCSCCPENYIWDVEDQQCIIACDIVNDPENGGSFPVSECVSPREITENCDCVCPNGGIWGYDVDSKVYTCLSPEDRCPEYDPETGDPVGPVDGDGFPLYTRWDPIDKECQCEKGNFDINDCQPYKYLNTNTCECYCPEGKIQSEEYSNECECEPNKIERNKTIDDSQNDDIRLRLPCVTCEEFLGEFAKPDVEYGGDGIARCVCQDGYIQGRIVVEDNLNDTILEPDCIPCAAYDPNSVWNNTDKICDCAPGFTKVIDNDAPFRLQFNCIPVTPAPTTETPTPPPSSS